MLASNLVEQMNKARAEELLEVLEDYVYERIRYEGLDREWRHEEVLNDLREKLLHIFMRIGTERS